MSFTSLSIVDSCQGFEDFEFVRNHRGALIADTVILIAITAVAGLVLGGIIHIGVPAGVGTISSKVIWGIVGGAGFVALVDITFLIKHLTRKPTDDEVANAQAVASLLRNAGVSEEQVNALTSKFKTTEKAKNSGNAVATSQVCSEKAVMGEWFILDTSTPMKEYLARHIGVHSVYVKFNESKESIEQITIDANYTTKHELTDTYKFFVQIEKDENDENQSKIKFTDTVFHVEAREFRKDDSGGEVLASWGEDLQSEGDQKMKGLFYQHFAKPLT